MSEKKKLHVFRDWFCFLGMLIPVIVFGALYGVFRGAWEAVGLLREFSFERVD